MAVARWIVVLAIALVPARADAESAAQAFAAAKQLHADAQAKDKCSPSDAPCKAQLVPLFEAAQRAWVGYVARFPNAPDVVEARYYSADILYFKLGHFEAAGDAYVVVAKSRPVGRFHRDALVNAIAAFDTARGRGQQATPIDDKLRAAAALYASLFAGGPDTIAIVFKLAQLDLDREKLDDAARAFALILTKYPRAPEAGPAGDRLLVIANKSSDYAALWELTHTLAKAPAFATKDQQLRLEALRFEASSKLGDREAMAQRFAKAADFYLRAAGEAKRAQEAVQAMTNAGVMFERARVPDRALETYRAIADRWPTDAAAPKTLFGIARLEEAVLRWERAADAYEQVATRYPADPAAADALYNSGILRAALGQADRAIAMLDRYTSAYKARADVPQAALLAAKLREDKGDLTGALTAYVAVAGMAGGASPIDARVGAARVAFKLGRDQQAEAHLAAVIALAAQSPRDTGKRARAEAQLWQARLAARKADAVSIVVAPSQLPRALATKMKLWTVADQRFADVVAADDATVAIAALRESAANHEQLARMFEALPPPAGLGRAEQTVYRQQLQQFADAMKSRAIDLYRGAYAKAVELSVYSADTVAIHDALVRLGVVPPDGFARGSIRSELPAPAPAIVERR